MTVGPWSLPREFRPRQDTALKARRNRRLTIPHRNADPRPRKTAFGQTSLVAAVAAPVGASSVRGGARLFDDRVMADRWHFARSRAGWRIKRRAVRPLDGTAPPGILILRAAFDPRHQLAPAPARLGVPGSRHRRGLAAGIAPHTCRSRSRPGSAQLGGKGTFPRWGDLTFAGCCPDAITATSPSEPSCRSRPSPA